VDTVSVVVEGQQRYLPVVTVTLPNGSTVTGIYTMDGTNRPVTLNRIPNGEIAPAAKPAVQPPAIKPQPTVPEPKLEPKPQPTVPESKLEPKPQPTVPEPKLEPKPQPTVPEPKLEPKPQPTVPEPKLEPKPEPNPPDSSAADAAELARKAKQNGPVEKDGDGVEMSVGPTETREALARLSTSRTPGNVVNQGALGPPAGPKVGGTTGTPEPASTAKVVPPETPVKTVTPPPEKPPQTVTPPLGKINTLPPEHRIQKPRISPAEQAQLDLIAAEEQGRNQDWQKRRGKGKGGDDGDGGGGKKKNGRTGRPRDWRQANEDEDF